MNFEDELEQRLGETANRIESSPDLSWVETEAGRRHKRQRRSPAALGALAVVALGLAGTAYLVGGSAAVDDSASDDPPSTDAVESADAAGSTGGAADTQSPSAPESVDPATPFLERTVEIYRRDIGDRQIVVRRSDLSWAELFDLEWRAPTGTAELCMGDRAIFIGDPAARGGYGGSAWTPIEVFDQYEGEVTVDQGVGGLAVVRTSGAADQVAVVVGDTEFDRAAFVDGLAVLDLGDTWGRPDPESPSLVLFSGGVGGDPLPLTSAFGRPVAEYERECTPGPFPQLPLPAPGEQPSDPASAEAEILAVYERALDRSVPLSADDPAAVDDLTGLEDAVAEVDAGEMAEVAASAEHAVDEMVFTSPDEAWFRYTISTTVGEFGGRFGIARFDGSSWKITRDTICQDLAMAGGTCVPPSSTIEPPEPEYWPEVIAAYERTSALYWSSWDCLPHPFGPGPCDDVDTVPQVTAVIVDGD